MKITSRVLIGGLVLAISSLAVVPTQAAPKEKLLWAEYFGEKAGTRANPKYWSYDMGNGSGWGNNEQEYYTNKSANLKTDGKGKLVIKAIKLDIDNPKDNYITYWCVSCEYSSAKIVTRGKLTFKYGTIEARIQIPEGEGMWPAFWMLGVSRPSCDGWPSCGEIDIMEARGSDTYRAVQSLHGPGYSGGTALSHYFVSPEAPLHLAYHTYRVDWLPNSIKFYIDNKFIGGETKSSVAPDDWVFNAEFYLILNLATGGNFDGGKLDTTIQSAEMKVDWIKYSTLKGYGKLTKR
jgi:beta-glucanase (GH16 family)